MLKVVIKIMIMGDGEFDRKVAGHGKRRIKK